MAEDATRAGGEDRPVRTPGGMQDTQREPGGRDTATRAAPAADTATGEAVNGEATAADTAAGEAVNGDGVNGEAVGTTAGEWAGFELDPEAQDVYRAMLLHPHDGVAELARRLGRDQGRIRRALDRLSALALVRPTAQDADAMRAVNPEVGMDTLLAQQRAELAAQEQRLAETKALAARLAAEYHRMRPYEEQAEAEVLLGVETVRQRLAEITREVREEVLSFAPDGAQTEENRVAAQPLNQQLLDRGVRMRTVYLDSIRNSPATVAHASWLTERGGQVRTVPSLPTRMIIVDRRLAVVPVDPENSAKGAAVLTGTGVLAALCALFEQVWQGAVPLGEAPERREDAQGLTGQERMALWLLAEGYTDEAIAKRLGVSPRTARRLASALMERLGARSRFQAGALAASRGWLHEQPGGRADVA
ncbi:helix-turn-helix transcriptional regulator [Streptomyces sp. NRRL S-118]|uniref:helix-turn-helix transcriptional regulator n=1 Tax=Streptomyces sp. NRRL S-118 TaxID=1463881 RepID=UPI000AE9808B|nr:helix-turn-helix transcriptional regulator [Streptomyces sp. NRRL S-118]